MSKRRLRNIIISILACYFVITTTINIIQNRNDHIKLINNGFDLAKEHLEKKYVEEMMLLEGHSYYDNVVTYYAQPKNKPSHKFRVNYILYEPIRIEDDYLLVCLEQEMSDIVKKVANQYFKDTTYTVLLDITLRNSLAEFYNEHKRPLSWYDTEHPDIIYDIVIRLFEDIEGKIDKSKFKYILDETHRIGNELDIDIQRVTFIIYASKEQERKEPKEHINYNMVDGDYQLRE